MTEDFRITFFYGPDNVPDRPEAVMCVFNVKKRSWKGGVQVVVELAQAQLEQLRERGLLGELFTQQVCRAKLDLAIAAGINQENQTIAADALKEALDKAVIAKADAIR